MLYGPYIKSLRSWDGIGGLSSTSTATIYSCQGPSNSKIWGYTHINVVIVTCHDGCGFPSEGHQMLYGPYIKSLRSLDGIGGLSSTSTATIIALCEKAKITSETLSLGLVPSSVTRYIEVTFL